MQKYFGKQTFNEQVEFQGNIKVVLLGDQGTGKSTVAEYLSAIKDHALGPTQGCQVLLKTFKVTRQSFQVQAIEQNYFVELWDIGSNSRYKDIRKVFLKDVDGAIFVYNLLDQRSKAQISKWHNELQLSSANIDPRQQEKTKERSSMDIDDIEQNVTKNVPSIVVGTRADQADAKTFSIQQVFHRLWQNLLSLLQRTGMNSSIQKLQRLNSRRTSIKKSSSFLSSQPLVQFNSKHPTQQFNEAINQFLQKCIDQKYQQKPGLYGT